MKNILIVSSLLMLVTACSSGYKYNRAEETPLKGVWVVQDVQYSEKKIKVTAFGVADAQCFKGSVWTLVPNNHTGKMIEGATNTEDCPLINTDFTWYIDENDTFNLKPLADGMKAKDEKAGYLFKVQRTSDTTFTLVQTANLEGSPVYITYNFIKQ